MIKLEINVVNSHKLSDTELMQEILLAETRMNASSKIRFHIANVYKLEQEIKIENKW